MIQLIAKLKGKNFIHKRKARKPAKEVKGMNENVMTMLETKK